MKNLIKLLILALMLLQFTACNSNQMKFTSSPNGVRITFVANKNYLILPIEDKTKELPTAVIVDGTNIISYNLCLAQDQVDYYNPLDISEWKGRTITIEIQNLSADAVSLKEIKQSDKFEYKYNEAYRPVYHFTPPYGWMNDPNGMVYYNGDYHLFYQWNPYGSRWENMTWGHATSKDLLTWEHHYGAIFPDSLGTIFSGSTVVDIHNRSGLQTGSEKVLLSYYTYYKIAGDTYEQSQGLAYSNDAGVTWQKYAKNPIVTKPGFKDFRDPKVIWHEPSKKWIMLLSVDHYMELYSSANGIDWTLESEFGKTEGAHTGQWECPDLFEVKVANSDEKKWVLICNMNPGGIHGGSATQYFVGSFDGKTFTNESKPQDVKWLDWGKDFYAAVTWANMPDARHMGIAWMSNWDYGKDVPTKNFRSAMTVPREFKLVKTALGYTLFNYPSTEINKLRKQTYEFDEIKVDGEHYVDNICEECGGAFEITFNAEKVTGDVFGFKLYNNKGEFTDIYLNLSEKKIWFNRINSGKTDFSEKFACQVYAPLEKKDKYQVRILVDKSSIEFFEGNGQVSMTNIIFPTEPYSRLSFYSKGGGCRITNLKIYKLAL